MSCTCGAAAQPSTHTIPPPLPVRPAQPSSMPIQTSAQNAPQYTPQRNAPQAKMSTPTQRSTDPYENGLQIVPDCITPNEGEIPVRQYNIATLSKTFLSKTEGRIQVTNQRVIFRASGRTSLGRELAHSEFAIDEIAGFETKSSRYTDHTLLFSGLIALLVFGYFGFTTGGTGGALMYILAIAAMAVAVRFGIKPCISLSILNKSSNPVVNIPHQLCAIPTPETDVAIRELGAIINDIQKLGDHGVQKWQQ